MRRLYIVMYDISHPKRLRKVFKIMRGFGDRIQLSVFRAELTPKERIQMMMKINPVIHHNEDQVLMIPIGPAGGEIEKEIEALGRPYEPCPHGAVVV
ncbi:MAG: CRISPR-associated endonuclease Cas2 [Candidatus Omnitrophota bacterium]